MPHRLSAWLASSVLAMFSFWMVALPSMTLRAVLQAVTLHLADTTENTPLSCSDHAVWRAASIDVEICSSCVQVAHDTHLTMPKDRKVDMKEVATPKRVKSTGTGGTVPFNRSEPHR